MSKRVAILTGGGDVPGLNMCLKSLVYRLMDLGYEPIGVRKGWNGLIQYDAGDPTTYSDNFVELTKPRVRAIDQTSGSFLHSSRIDPRAVPPAHLPPFLSGNGGSQHDLSEHILSVIERLGLRALIVVGDDDTLRYAAHLRDQGVPLVAIPKTIHNNINGTDYTLGFSTGLARGVAFVHELRALAASREQVVVMETFGDHSGYAMLLMALLAGVDRAVIPEVPYDPHRLAHLVLQDKQMTPSNYAVVAVANGARVVPQMLPEAQRYLASAGWGQSEPGDGGPLDSSGLVVAQLLQHLLHEEVFFQQLTYLMRTGTPDGQDLLGAMNFAMMAAGLVAAGQYGRMTAFQQRQSWTHVDLASALGTIRTVDVEHWYDNDNYRPTQGLIWSAVSATNEQPA